MEQNQTAQTNVTQIAESDTNGDTAKVEQTPEQNREFARLRRIEEREKSDKRLAESVTLKTAKEILGVNPFTNKEFDTIEDYNDYLLAKNSQKSQKNSQKTQNNTNLVNNDGKSEGDGEIPDSSDLKAETDVKQVNGSEDNFSHSDEKEVINGSREELTSDNEKVSDDWFIKDKKDFFIQNPEFDETKFRQLLTSPEFCEFADGKVGKRPLGEIYNDYRFLLKKVEILAEQKAHTMYLKKISSPGSLSRNDTIKGQNVWSTMSGQEFEEAIKNAKNGMYKNN